MKKLKVTSSSIERFEYNEKKETLKVFFKDGSVHSYRNVPEITYSALEEIEEGGGSVGYFFNKVIRNQYEVT